MGEFPVPYAGPAAARYGNYNKRYMVVHCTSNNASPANEAAYARRRTDGVGMHFCSDPSTVLQVLESWYGTGHVGSTAGNRYGISWEFVGFTSSSRSYYELCINRAAPTMRLAMARWGIPHRWLTDAQLRGGVVKGLVTHQQCSRVLGGSNHTDPGPNFPSQYLINALNGATVSAPNFDPYSDPTLRTMAQRIDAMRGGVVDYEVEYDNDPNTPKIQEKNKLAETLIEHGEQIAELLARPPIVADLATLTEAMKAALQDPTVLAALKPVMVDAVNEAEDS
jgi:hypothetical protein